MSCELCTDPDGLPCFPCYGLAPHTHTKEGIVFDINPVEGFTPDENNPTHGVWWCPNCGEGKPMDKEKRERLEEDGWKFGDADDFLGPADKE